MNDWKTADTAPRDGSSILVFGQPSDLVISGDRLAYWKAPMVLTAHWDEVDQAFCVDGGSWLGPFVEPTHWMPKPKPPTTGSIG